MKDDFKDILKCQGIKAKGFGIMPKIIAVDRRLSRDAKAIYSYFCSFAGAGSTAFPSVGKICYDLTFGSQDTFRKHFKQLLKYDYIRVEKQRNAKGRFERNVYTLVEKPNPKEEKEESYETTSQNLGDGENNVTQIYGDGKSRGQRNRVTNNNSIYNINNNKKESFIHSKEVEQEGKKEVKKIINYKRSSLKEVEFDEQFYNELMDKLQLQQHFSTGEIAEIKVAIIQLLAGKNKSYPVTIVKAMLSYLDCMSIEEALNIMHKTQNIKSPIAYLSSCLIKAAAEHKARVENFSNTY